jgi:hypothetical protein
MPAEPPERRKVKSGPAGAGEATDRHERAKDYLSPAEMARLLAADDPAGPLAMANLHSFAVTGPQSSGITSGGVFGLG